MKTAENRGQIVKRLKKIRGMRMEQKVLYNGQFFILTRFWATGEPCLWITDSQQIEIPKMEFVGGHPDEYCIFLKNLTETELAQITSPDGSPLDRYWKKLLSV